MKTLVLCTAVAFCWLRPESALAQVAEPAAPRDQPRQPLHGPQVDSIVGYGLGHDGFGFGWRGALDYEQWLFGLEAFRHLGTVEDTASFTDHRYGTWLILAAVGHAWESKWVTGEFSVDSGLAVTRRVSCSASECTTGNMAAFPFGLSLRLIFPIPTHALRVGLEWRSNYIASTNSPWVNAPYVFLRVRLTD